MLLLHPFWLMHLLNGNWPPFGDIHYSLVSSTAQITNLKLTCEELILSFELPQHFLSTAVNLQLQTKVRFIEILPFGVSDSESRVVNATYEVASTLDCPSNAEGCTVDIDLRGGYQMK